MKKKLVPILPNGISNSIYLQQENTFWLLSLDVYAVNVFISFSSCVCDNMCERELHNTSVNRIFR